MCENALVEAIRRLESPIPSNQYIKTNFSKKADMVGRAGFEPATSSVSRDIKPDLHDFYNFLIDCENKQHITARQYCYLLRHFFEKDYKNNLNLESFSGNIPI